MKRTTPTLLAVLTLAASAPAAMASVTVSETYGPHGFSESRTVRHGHKTVTEKISFGPHGIRDCRMVTRTRRTFFGVDRFKSKSCR